MKHGLVLVIIREEEDYMKEQRKYLDIFVLTFDKNFDLDYCCSPIGT